MGRKYWYLIWNVEFVMGGISRVYPQQLGVDPVSVALEFAGAAIAPQHEVRMINETGGLECPLVDSHFQ